MRWLQKGINLYTGGDIHHLGLRYMEVHGTAGQCISINTLLSSSFLDELLAGRHWAYIH